MDRFYRICHRLVAAPIRLIFRIKVTGRENEPNPGDGGDIVCANHMGMNGLAGRGLSQAAAPLYG